MKIHKAKPEPTFMMHVVTEVIDQLYWKLYRILDEEGISMLQWAFMQRAYDCRKGVSFRQIIEVTSESKDNVRRAANSLKGFAEVVAEPGDRRARRFVLTSRGRKRVGLLMIQFQREMLKLIGAKDESSDRVREFKSLLWDASAFLAPSDLSSGQRIKRSKENRTLHPDTSLKLVEDETLESMWIAEDLPDGQMPW